jgi:holo-[acyl-carrier protein] synthase
MEPAPDNRIRVGVDLVSVARLDRLLTDHEHASERLFTSGELAYCRGKRRAADHLAARFAAKEAVLKALGSAMAQGARWTDVEVVSRPSGRPTVVLHGEAAARAGRRELRELDVSLSHTAGLAVANVVSVWAREGLH